MSQIMVTKLSPPRVGSGLIDRPRLLELYARNPEVKLIMVTAAAGYGKTVSILQYVNTIKAPFVWYQLDQYDNDPAVFIQYLIAGVQNYYPGFGAEVLRLVLQGNILPSLRFIIVSLVNGLASLLDKGLVLVLDDYHVITSSVIHQFVQELLENLPSGIRFILGSRVAPELPLTRFQGRGVIEVIESEALKFTAPEVNEFLAKRRIEASGPWVDSLISKADGWPAALKLLTDTTSAKSQTLSTKQTKYIYDYLVDEVLAQLSETTRQFLLSTAVLETMTPRMCDLLLERSDSNRVLDNLERQQLFLIPLTGVENAYRYHQLFRDFLLIRLGSQRDRLLRKAGAIFLSEGNLDQAIEYYLTAGVCARPRADRDLLSLLEKGGKEALRQGRWQTVERWLGMLSREQILADDWLCFFQAQIKIFQGKLDEAEGWISKSLTGFSTRRDAIGIAECQFLQARIYNQRDRVRESLALLEQAYPVLQKTGPFLRFDLPMEMAITLFKNERFQEAEQILTQALQEAMRQNDYLIMSHLLEGLGHIYYFGGELTKGLQYYQKGLRISPTQTLPSYSFQDFSANIYLEWGESELALEYAKRSVAFKEKMGLFEPLPSAYLQLGGVLLFRGEVEKAEICLRKGIALAEKKRRRTAFPFDE
ncbi:MAG TPA: hypothetical protein VHY08_21480 [Bacillota bacterium]|nr:hypothetical protein [Bacillota bacterium]